MLALASFEQPLVGSPVFESTMIGPFHAEALLLVGFSEAVIRLGRLAEKVDPVALREVLTSLSQVHVAVVENHQSLALSHQKTYWLPC